LTRTSSTNPPLGPTRGENPEGEGEAKGDKEAADIEAGAAAGDDMKGDEAAVPTSISSLLLAPSLLLGIPLYPVLSFAASQGPARCCGAVESMAMSSLQEAGSQNLC